MLSLKGKIIHMGSTVVLLLTMFLLAAHGAMAANDYSQQASKALTWMKTQQQPDGSFAGFGAGSTVDAVLAIIAAGQDPTTYTNGGKSPVDFLQSKTADLAQTPGGAGKLLILASALEARGKSFSGQQALVDAIGPLPANGQYGKDITGHAFVMLGLASVGSVPPKAVQVLEAAQAADGGWSFSGDTKAGASDTNTTAVAVQALIAAGVAPSSDVLQKAKAYLLGQQNADGGFPYQKGGESGSESDVNSTAYVAQALGYLGENPEKALDFIASMQKANGAFQWMKSQPDDNAGATYQAVPALLGATLAAPIPGEVNSAVGNPQPVVGSGASEGVSTPGMPTTGRGEDLPALAAWMVLAASLLSGGMALRRRPVR